MTTEVAEAGTIKEQITLEHIRDKLGGVTCEMLNARDALSLQCLRRLNLSLKRTPNKVLANRLSR
jgi:hypothetical protein